MADNYTPISTKLVGAKLAFEKKPIDVATGLASLKTALVDLTLLAENTLTAILRKLIHDIEKTNTFTPASAALLGQVIAAVFTKMKLDTSLNRAMDTFQKSAPESSDKNKPRPKDSDSPSKGTKKPPKKPGSGSFNPNLN